jgi:hypothetical protein
LIDAGGDEIDAKTKSDANWDQKSDQRAIYQCDSRTDDTAGPMLARQKSLRDSSLYWAGSK